MLSHHKPPPQFAPDLRPHLRPHLRPISQVGTAICLWRGWLPAAFPSVALDPAVVLNTPRLPRGMCYLRRARFDWEAPKQSLFRKVRSPMTSKGSPMAPRDLP